MQRHLVSIFIVSSEIPYQFVFPRTRKNIPSSYRCCCCGRGRSGSVFRMYRRTPNSPAEARLELGCDSGQNFPLFIRNIVRADSDGLSSGIRRFCRTRSRACRFLLALPVVNDAATGPCDYRRGNPAFLSFL